MFEQKNSEFYDKLIQNDPNLCLMRLYNFSQIETMNNLHRKAVFSTPNGLQISPGTRLLGVEPDKNTKFYYDDYRPSPIKGSHTEEILKSNGIEPMLASEIVES